LFIRGCKRVEFAVKPARNWWLAIFMPLFLLTLQASSQNRLKVPVSINIEDGDFSEVSVVIKNVTTGESNSIKGAPKLDLDLKLDNDYIISFSKPGYITKKMAINTNAPADRAAQGFYPYDFVMNLFPQYEGVNIVIFNQPVGKVFYNRLIDDFDYDTDYTKQIQSALKAADEEVKKKQAEEKLISAQKKKEAEKNKADSLVQAKADAKAKLEADKKAADENKLLAAQKAKEQKMQEEERKIQAKAAEDEEKRRLAVAKMEEEERRKAKAAEDEEARLKPVNGSGQDVSTVSTSSVQGSETRAGTEKGGGEDKKPVNSGTGQGAENQVKNSGTGKGNDVKPIADVPVKIAPEKPEIKKSNPTMGVEEKPVPVSVTVATKSTAAVIEQYETMPEISVEEITEANRTITKVTVRKGEKTTIYSKVKYNWGGLYFFRNTMSISESLFTASTGQK
jgi:hypothetical protein